MHCFVRRTVHTVVASCEQLVFEPHVYYSAWLKQSVLRLLIKHVSSPQAQVCAISIDIHLPVQSPSSAFTAHHMLCIWCFSGESQPVLHQVQV